MEPESPPENPQRLTVEDEAELRNEYRAMDADRGNLEHFTGPPKLDPWEPKSEA